MSWFSPGPGRTYLYGLYGTLIALVSGGVIYLNGGTGYLSEAYVVLVGAFWTIVTFLKERNHSQK